MTKVLRSRPFATRWTRKMVPQTTLHPTTQCVRSAMQLVIPRHCRLLNRRSLFIRHGNPLMATQSLRLAKRTNGATTTMTSSQQVRKAVMTSTRD